MKNLKTITEVEYNKIHKDYKGIYSSDEIHNTNWNGKRTMMKWDNGTTLFIEDASFKIVKTEKENINPFDN